MELIGEGRPVFGGVEAVFEGVVITQAFAGWQVGTFIRWKFGGEVGWHR
jgi:hypothetical protein